MPVFKNSPHHGSVRVGTSPSGWDKVSAFGDHKHPKSGINVGISSNRFDEIIACRYPPPVDYYPKENLKTNNNPYA